MSRCLLLIPALVMMAGCSGPAGYLQTAEEPWLRYEHTPCFGPCPAFILEVNSNGDARYNGRRNVKNEGKFSGQWDEQFLRAVADAAHRADLKRNAGVYDNPMVTDLPTKRILLGGHVFVDRIDAPPMDGLYGVLDSLISITDWTASGQ